MSLGGTLVQPIKSNFLLFQPIDWSFQLSKSQIQSVSVNEDRFHYYCRSQYKDIFWPRVRCSRSDMSCFCLLLPFLNLQAQIRNIFLFLIGIFSFFLLEYFPFSNWNNFLFLIRIILVGIFSFSIWNLLFFSIWNSLVIFCLFLNLWYFFIILKKKIIISSRLWNRMPLLFL